VRSRLLYGRYRPVIMEKMFLPDLPNGFESKFWPKIRKYSVGLIKVGNKDDDRETEFCGSGTFFKFGNHYGILTAAHVVIQKAMEDSYALGINLMISEEHRLQFEIKELNILFIRRNKFGPYGPDIAAIILPVEKIGLLKEKKGFYNISQYPQNLSDEDADSSGYLNTGIGLWTVCGCPDDFKSTVDSTRNFKGAWKFTIPRMSCIIENELIKDGYDYLDFVVPTDCKEPNSFGGVSGGGLWHVPLAKHNKDIICGIPILSGVAYYEEHVAKNKRIIRCHGRKSIYEILPQYLKEKL